MGMKMVEAKDEHTDTERISSRGLAVLIVDALVDAGVLKDGDADRAIVIATEEINARKAMGDY